MIRVLVYLSLALFLLYILPFGGEFRFSNKASEYIFLSGEKQAVTFPWGGVLIKSNIDERILDEVIAHEICHINQINRHGGFSFIIEYNKSPDKFENECYGIKG